MGSFLLLPLHAQQNKKEYANTSIYGVNAEDTRFPSFTSKTHGASLIYHHVSFLSSGRLDPCQKCDICLMKIQEELSHKKIAERLELSVNTIKRKILFPLFS